MNYILYFSIALFVASAACKATDTTSNARLKNYTGLDGCSWVIELNNGKKLEPINLNEFVSRPVDGKRIYVEYVVEPGMGSICMVGEIVRITALK